MWESGLKVTDRNATGDYAIRPTHRHTPHTLPTHPTHPTNRHTPHTPPHTPYTATTVQVIAPELQYECGVSVTL